mmetsp:Transcript_11841/g.46233  ORF Transcript_11841/g.46233 Transcript_11841/m.46233 type:complete len:298 (+) Transcript_11841:2960-3853(+)
MHRQGRERVVKAALVGIHARLLHLAPKLAHRPLVGVSRRQPGSQRRATLLHRAARSCAFASCSRGRRACAASRCSAACACGGGTIAVLRSSVAGAVVAGSVIRFVVLLLNHDCARLLLLGQHIHALEGAHLLFDGAHQVGLLLHPAGVFRQPELRCSRVKPEALHRSGNQSRRKALSAEARTGLGTPESQGMPVSGHLQHFPQRFALGRPDEEDRHAHGGKRGVPKEGRRRRERPLGSSCRSAKGVGLGSLRWLGGAALGSALRGLALGRGDPARSASSDRCCHGGLGLGRGREALR